jgi:AbiEi antitoxin C-terminal domain/Transcriptional regulator, AbiEi antitoxin
MGYPILRTSQKPWASQQLWALAERQHGVVSRRQLLDLGLSAKSIKHRIAVGCLHPIWRGVYAIGRPQLTLRGRWMAAILSCGRDAVLSHGSAAAHWEILPARGKEVEVTVPAERRIARPGIVICRRTTLSAADVTRHHSIPVTTPVCTLVDLATRLERGGLEAAINQADKRDLTDPDTLRSALDELARRPGARAHAILAGVVRRLRAGPARLRAG